MAEKQKRDRDDEEQDFQNQDAGPETNEELVEEWEDESFPGSDAPQNF